MRGVFFSRLTLKRDAAVVAPLIETLAPADAGEAMNVTHRLLWTAMRDDVRAAHVRKCGKALHESPFLWRAAAAGTFYVLGPRPAAESPFFRIETKPYAPSFHVGDRLVFDLRVNATVHRKTGVDANGQAQRKRLDIVMDRLLREEQAGADRKKRAARRDAAAEAAATDWLDVQGERDGFQRLESRLLAYRNEALPRRAGKKATLGIIDLQGLLEVREPSQFVDRVLKGLGRAKAFGCGLMLLRRAR